MRFSSFLPLAVLVAAASVAVARPVDDYMLASRSDADVSLYARDFQLLDYLVARSDAHLSLSARGNVDIVDLLRRGYLSAALVARNELDQPQREHYKTHEEWKKAWLQWSRRSSKMAKSIKKATDAHTAGLDQPQREHYKTHEEHEGAWRNWNRQNSKMSKAIKKATDANAATYKKQQGGPKGLFAKLFGKKNQ